MASTSSTPIPSIISYDYNDQSQSNMTKFLIHYNELSTVIYLPNDISLENFLTNIRSICQFPSSYNIFTIKWLDEALDAITITTQKELFTAIRLYHKNNDKELHIHVFNTKPDEPGLLCTGEDRIIYRRGARRWRKLYLINGHRYQAKRFSTTASCTVCNDRLWGLGRQGYKCLDCRVLVHKRCVKQLRIVCGLSTSVSPQPLQQKTNIDNTNKQNVDSSRQNRKTPTTAENQHQQNGFYSHHHQLQQPQDKIGRHRLVEASGMNARDPMVKQKMLTVNEPGSLKRFPDQQLSSSIVDGSSPYPRNEMLTDDRNSNYIDDSSSSTISLQDFELLKVIGRGSYAKVFLAEYRPKHRMTSTTANGYNQNQQSRLYAMKVIKKSIVNDDEDIDWIQCEKNVFEKATNHPFLVGLHSCFQTPSRLFFVIEFVTGGDLMYHMQRQRKLPEAHARFYAAEITVGLHFLHEHGVIYRDLKLDNVLLDAEGHIKLTDYGMCKQDLLNGEKTSTFCGTPNYIAPEMLKNLDYDFSVDWWALGVLMFEMMAGRSPFEMVGSAESPDLNTEDRLFQVILQQPIRIPRSLTVRAKQVLEGFLNKNPKERLGCRGPTCHEGFDDIRIHPFFNQINWVKLESKQIIPPYKPIVANEHDLSHFDPQFTNEDVVLTPEDDEALAKINQSEFEGFEYVNPLIMTVEENV
ncbi:unnamed protein product [Didymodactylos carnosus]|uniref:protein kinase C n=1 Tax=Didymodactylos carnosus TaxID=1234261 RepID=A0A814D3Z4_9BILA|nr:unnamed protein product [Didymodactylos carnosus]CAF0948510.1 unnamed protein product [Didymodactylos carnosus]CAF3528870.1 unnamed protein product [Didymodactylos carnosus]CAF3724427.1 unnamed protein product [Didymodactylos carnosus]